MQKQTARKTPVSFRLPPLKEVATQLFTPKIPLFIPIDRDNIYLSDIAQSTVVPEIQNDLIPKATTLATQISSYLDELNPHNYPRGGRS